MGFFDFFQRKNLTIGSQSGLRAPTWKSTDAKAYAKEGYMLNNVGFRCVEIIAKNMAAVKLQVRLGDDLAPDHPLQKLLEKPNPIQGSTELYKSLVAYHQITGNTYMEYIEGMGMPNELWVIPPFDMSVAVSKNSRIPLGYVFNNGQIKKTWEVDAKTGQSKMLHWHTFNPLDMYNGLSPFAAAAYQVDINNKSSEWNKSLLDNDTRPSGVLSSKTNITSKQFAQISKEIKEYKSGPANTGEFLLLDGGLQWQQMGLTPKDMDWLQSRNVTAGDIAMVFGVPNQVLGIPGSQTFANYEQARLALWEDTILPLLDGLVAELNNWLVPAFKDERLSISYDKDTIIALEPRRRDKWAAIQNANWLTINEKREATDYDPSPEEGADQIYISAGMLPLGFDVFEEDPTGEKALIAEWVRSGLTKEQAQAKYAAIRDYKRG